MTAFLLSLTVFFGADGFVDGLVAPDALPVFLRKLCFDFNIVAAPRSDAKAAAGTPGGWTTDGGDGPLSAAAIGLKGGAPQPPVRRDGAPLRRVRIDFFTGDLLVSDAGNLRGTAPRFFRTS